MSLLTRGRGDRAGSRTGGLAGRLSALEEVLDLAPGRLDPALEEEARRVAAKAGDRLRFGEGHTVVALAGATGSGKSSLVNALAGAAVSEPGMRRPTTGVAHAAVWPDPAEGEGDGGTGLLLDWLEVPRRHVLPAPAPGSPAAALAGLVVLDLPDVDSVQAAHRLEADRLVERVDLLVFVLDPQKYADASLHDRYLVPLAGHAGVMLILLNQVDRLTPAAREGCLADLRRLLRSEGLGSVTVIPVSARTGEGLDDVRGELARHVAAKHAAAERLAADLSGLGAALDGVCGTGSGQGAGVGRRERAALVAALTDAAGADAVGAAVDRAYRVRAARRTGWPFTRWVGRLRPDPARRFRLPDNPSELVRTSLPGPSAVQRARVDTAVRELSAAAAGGLADPWPAVVREAAGRRRGDLPELLDRAVAGAELGLARKPRWWGAVGAVQTLLAIVALVGLVWLAVLFGVAWLQLPPPPMPHLGAVPLPTVLLVGGVLLGLLLALLSRSLARAAGRRAGARARRAVEERVERVADDAIVTPVETELAAHVSLCAAVRRLHG